MKVNQNDDLITPDDPIFDVEAYDRIKPKLSAYETITAMQELSAMDTPTQAIYQMREIRDAEKEDSTLIPVKDLNEMYPDLGTPFNEPKSKRVADIIAERQRRRQELGSMIAAGPDGRFMGIAKFGAAMLPHAVDPVNVGSGLAVSALTAGFGLVAEGAQVARAAKAAVTAARAAGIAEEAAVVGQAVRTLKAAQAGLSTAEAYEAVIGATNAAGTVSKVFANPYIRSFGEGVIGNVAAEGFVMGAAIQEGRPYTAEDAFYNTVAGAMLIPGITFGVKKAAMGLRYTGKFALNRGAEFLNRIDPKYSELLHNTSVGRLLSDKLPKTEVFIEQALRELHGGAQPSFSGVLRYNHIPLSDGPVAGRFFAATYKAAGGVRNAVTESVDSFLGNAVYLTDNPAVANGAAARGVKDQVGQVLEVNVNDLNLINLNKPAPEALHALLKEMGVTVKDLESHNMQDIMHRFQDDIQSNKLDPDFIEKFNERLKAEGYDGYRSDGTKVEGQLQDPHNSLIVFNKEKVDDVAVHDAEPERVGEMDEARIRQLREESASEQSQMLHENPQEQLRKVQQDIKEPPKSDDMRIIEQNEQLAVEEIKALEKQDLLEESDKTAFEEIKAAATEHEQIVQSLKDAAACIGLD